ncbi:MAG: DUF6496 domain-containing protein [bacterium]|nr:DUF6496 domain-containing protein [bacterium]
MNKYGPKSLAKIEKIMQEYGRGNLRSSSGRKFTDQKQAIAIGISEAKKHGFKNY